MPNWLQAFVWNAAEHFDPLGSLARAGYVVSEEDGRWVVRLFLGETEVIGGAEDGAVIPTAFALDLDAVRREFERIDRFEWHGLPAGSAPEQLRDDATVAVDGAVHGQDLRLLISLRPPNDMGPGLKRMADGSYQQA